MASTISYLCVDQALQVNVFARTDSAEVESMWRAYRELSLLNVQCYIQTYVYLCIKTCVSSVPKVLIWYLNNEKEVI